MKKWNVISSYKNFKVNVRKIIKNCGCFHFLLVFHNSLSRSNVRNSLPTSCRTENAMFSWVFVSHNIESAVSVIDRACVCVCLCFRAKNSFEFFYFSLFWLCMSDVYHYVRTNHNQTHTHTYPFTHIHDHWDMLIVIRATYTFLHCTTGATTIKYRQFYSLGFSLMWNFDTFGYLLFFYTHTSRRTSQ